MNTNISKIFTESRIHFVQYFCWKGFTTTFHPDDVATYFQTCSIAFRLPLNLLFFFFRFIFFLDLLFFLFRFFLSHYLFFFLIGLFLFLYFLFFFFWLFFLLHFFFFFFRVVFLLHFFFFFFVAHRCPLHIFIFFHSCIVGTKLILLGGSGKSLNTS